MIIIVLFVATLSGQPAGKILIDGKQFATMADCTAFLGTEEWTDAVKGIDSSMTAQFHQQFAYVPKCLDPLAEKQKVI